MPPTVPSSSAAAFSGAAVGKYLLSANSGRHIDDDDAFLRVLRPYSGGLEACRAAPVFRPVAKRSACFDKRFRPFTAVIIALTAAIARRQKRAGSPV